MLFSLLFTRKEKKEECPHTCLFVSLVHIHTQSEIGFFLSTLVHLSMKAYHEKWQ